MANEILTQSIQITTPQGQQGFTPQIGGNGNWWINGVDTGFSSRGENGADGVAGENGNTPYIGGNGNWWINGIDTGFSSRGTNVPNVVVCNPLQNGVDFNYLQGGITETVDYGDLNFQIPNWWSWGWFPQSVDNSTPTGTQWQGRLFEHWFGSGSTHWPRHIYDPHFAYATNFFVNTNLSSYPTINFSVQNITTNYCSDGVTPLSVILYLENDPSEIGNELKFGLTISIGWDVHENHQGFQDEIFWTFELLENNAVQFWNIQNINFTMPSETHTYVREYGLYIDFEDYVLRPNSVNVEIDVNYINQQGGSVQNGTIKLIHPVISSPMFFEIASLYVPNNIQQDSWEFSDNFVNSLFYVEGKMLFIGKRMGLEFPNWNTSFQVVEVTDVRIWKNEVYE